MPRSPTPPPDPRPSNGRPPVPPDTGPVTGPVTGLATGLASGLATPSAPGRRLARDHVEQSLRTALLTGRFIPGKAVTLRGLAQDLGVSPMPVREAIQRLAAENALHLKPSGRVQVPEMTESRFEEILATRVLLEPELARRALPFLDKAAARDLEDIDLKMDVSIATGDPEAYLTQNHAFHFRIYGAARSQVMLPLVESLWLQFAPYMRTVYGRVGTAILIDHHKEAVRAIRARDGEALAAAIQADIREGMSFLDRAGAPAPRPTTLPTTPLAGPALPPAPAAPGPRRRAGGRRPRSGQEGG
ncbi:GntR family transcriptional regulator [Pannonibacter tanglangensis]|uniref:FCD domain-containing protein n=1 Tax=Pannonibacter tanglangensis TaxID=2750084 RepID=A0ABW9ZI68_9HYPH|nr:GntR family transcriptional regulator [Pannonibacter sp. XCT-34]NBN64557.1 FCD domain-containing protein [Pannonibacter sp. XCT-34]